MTSPKYFDYAAATPLNPKVLKAMTPYMGDFFYNPSSEYLVAKQVSTDVEEARKVIASCLGVRSSELIFTAGGTEANNLAIKGIMELHSNSEVVTTSIEHKSVLEPVKQFENKLVLVSDQGYLDLEDLKRSISDKTVLVSVIYANNEIGTIQSIKEITSIIRAVKKDRQQRGVKVPLIFHTDASQAGNYLSLKVNSIGVDMMTVNGGKIYGPKQSGFLYVRSGIILSPQILGGGQENNMRSGTENVAGIIGLATAVRAAQTALPEESKRMRGLHDLFIKELTHKLPTAVMNGGTKRLPNNIHITVPGIDNETVMMLLDEAGYQVAVGSACSASSEEPSHVLTALGLSEEAASSSLRFTMGRFTSKEAICKLIDTLAKTCIAN